MDIKELNKRPDIAQNKKLHRAFLQFEKLIYELRKRELPGEIVSTVNTYIDAVNSISNSEKEFRKQLKKSRSGILKLIEKELKLVTKHHYRNIGLGVGMALGVAFGSVFGSSTNNTSLIGVGIPIGMAIGIAIGTTMDKKAKENGKQLDLEIH
jgi:hypothetical protein